MNQPNYTSNNTSNNASNSSLNNSNWHSQYGAKSQLYYAVANVADNNKEDEQDYENAEHYLIVNVQFNSSVWSYQNLLSFFC